MQRSKTLRVVRFWLAAIFLSITVTGCASLDRSDAVPADQEERANIPGMTGIRYFADSDPTAMITDAQASLARERSYLASTGYQGPLPPVDYLAISGGGENGAFGAGLLVGWTKAGTRPTFKVVTGISTGALTAPYAFLGSAYDEDLREIYTTLSAKDVLEARGLIAGALFHDAMADNAPLRQTVAKYFNQAMLDAIAAEYRKGRILLIGTTDLDARRPVIWNITKIAASGQPQSLKLVQDLLVASAAIPGAFPPMMIDVDVDGKPYQEMHVDGGASAQVFVYPPGLNLSTSGIVRKRTLYVIRNARLDPDWAKVDRSTMTIAARAISSLIQTQGMGDLYRIYAIAQRDGLDFNLAYIPKSFTRTLKEPFETAYMKDLYEVGYDMAVKGYPWVKAPPGFLAGTGPQPALQN
ncbi:MAG TPA: patatin-like phospholipase family protein [Dongiaceae bacterium]|jgi:predicted patatin/cPLA2 family phospholipase|nr:patatin-like phospholipase family protein [Dongiaceae bacterium]